MARILNKFGAMRDRRRSASRLCPEPRSQVSARPGNDP